MAYFRSYNDGQTKQIDDESVFMFQYVNPVTVQANNFNSQDWPLTSPRSTSPYVRGRDITINGIPQSADVVVSFEGTVHCWGWVQSRSSNSIVVRLYVTVLSDSNGSVTIRPWVNRVPSVNTQYGIRLRDGTPSNNIIYDSGAKVMRPLGFMHSDGYTGINTSGKSLAHIPQQWGTSGYRRIISGGVNSCQLSGTGGVYGYTRHEQWGSSYSFIKVNQNDRELILANYNSPTNYLGCYSSPWPFTDSFYSTLGNIRSLIIDVTNY